MSTNLNLSQVAAAQTQKEVTINDMSGQLDAALTEMLGVDLGAGSVTLTTEQWQRNQMFNCTGHTAARLLTVPSVKRVALVRNAGSAAVTVQTAAVGGAGVAVANSTMALVYCDGTNCYLLAGGGGGGGGGTFTSLADTFPAYTGLANALLRVNASETGLEAVTAASAVPAGQMWALPFRGALVQRAADLTGITFPVIVPFNLEVYDTDGFHDNNTNPSRITIPAGSGIKRVRFLCGIEFANGSGTNGMGTVQVWKNGTSGLQNATVFNRSASSGGFSNNSTMCATPVVDCIEGDYFEARVNMNGFPTNTILAGGTTFLAMEVVEADPQGSIVGEAPQDGRLYARQDGAWVDITDMLTP